MKLGMFAMTLAAGLVSALAMTGTASAGHNDRGYGYDNRSGGLVLFENPDFRGRALPVRDSVSSLSRIGFNDRVSSIRVFDGRWEVCTDSDFRGKCRVVDASVSKLGYLRLNDNISSVRKLTGPYQTSWNNHGWHDGQYGNSNGNGWGHNNGNSNGNGWGHGPNRPTPTGYGNTGAGAILFEHGNFDGRALPVGGDVFDLGNTGMNDAASSIRVNSGRWQVCSDPGFRGNCVVIDRSTYSLSPVRMNDNISSIRRIG